MNALFKDIRMLIATLGKHFPQRKMEWHLSGLTITWGLYALLHPGVFETEAFLGLKEMTPQALPPHWVWGGGAFVAGLVGAIALYINGNHFRTPVARLVSAFIRMFVFTQVTIGFWNSGVESTAVVVYPWLVVGDLMSAYAAGRDAVLSEYNHRVEQGTTGDVNSRFCRLLNRL